MRITNSIEKAIKLVLISFFFILPSCALTHYKEGHIIDRGDYSFIGPSGSGWLISKEEALTEFYKPADNSRLLIMHIKAGFDVKNQRYQNEEEVVSGWWNERQADATHYNCLSYNTKTGATEKDNTKIYFMHMIATGCSKGADNRGNATYLLFPVNFNVQHEFFGFYMVLPKDKQVFYDDFNIILPIIESFKINYH